MKLTIHAIRKMRKGKVWVVIECDPDKAQLYEIRKDKDPVRRVHSRAEAERLVALFSKPKKPIDKSALIGRRWSDVKDKL